MSDSAPGLPGSKTELFLAFNRLALQGFGGVLAVAQVELVERRGWLTRAEFVELLSASQVLPGPNVVNLALMLGDRWFGTRGAVAALGKNVTVVSQQGPRTFAVVGVVRFGSADPERVADVIRRAWWDRARKAQRAAFGERP